MADLEEFLGRKKPQVSIDGLGVQGAFACMECNLVSQDAFLNYEEKVLMWECKDCNHLNRVVMNV